MAAPELWIVAGPNGAGKTTCVQKEPMSRLLPSVTFFNPDDRTLMKLRNEGFSGFADAPADVQLQAFIESADEVFAELQRAVTVNQAVGVETVLSTEKYLPLVEVIRAKEGFVGLIYVALSSPAIARQRVAARVRRGGHGIPNDKIDQRWKRSLEMLPRFIVRATAFWILDNSDSNPQNPPELIAAGRNGVLEALKDSAFAEMRSSLLGLPLIRM